MLEIAVNKKQLQEIERTLVGVPRAMPRVMSRSINKVATKARTKIIRTVSKKVNVKQKDLRKYKNVGLTKAKYRKWIAVITISGRRIPLIKFGAKESKKGKGVGYRIKKGGGRERLPHAFEATMKSGHKGIFMRKTLSTSLISRIGRKIRGIIFGGRKHGLPIVELFGPSVPAVVEDIREVSEATLDREITANLKKEIATQIGLVLERRKTA